MYSILSTICYAVLSFVVLICMGIETNNRLQKDGFREEKSGIQPYDICTKNIIICSIIVLLSSICGYIISLNTVSVIANVKVGTCYLAILAASVIDYKIKIIPNYISIILICVRIILFVFEIFFSESLISEIINSIVGCFLSALLLIIANKISRGGIGGGDIKVIASIGLMCGIYVVFSTLILSLLVCAILSIILLILKKKNIKDHLPFGPFVYLGFLVMCLFSLY